MFVSLFCMFFFLFYVSMFLCGFVYCFSPCIQLLVLCVQFYRPLPPGGNLFAVYKYLIVSYQMLHRVSNVDVFRGMTTLRAVVNAVMTIWIS
jgi:hypothetical protein